MSNTILNPFSGYFYAFDGSGGFNVAQGFEKVALKSYTIVSQYDVTPAIQIKFSTQLLNNKLGIKKDANNSNVINSSYNSATGLLATDSYSINTTEFINSVIPSNIISVGYLNNLYRDFNYTVGTYFGDSNGFASLYANALSFNVNGGAFDSAALMQIVHSSQFNMRGSYISDISGSITVSNVNAALTASINNNLFQNRGSTQNKPTYTNEDGYIAGDFIFIPSGFTITLSLDIQPQSSILNSGPSNLSRVDASLNYSKGNFKRSTIYSPTNITQRTVVPLLLVLTDDNVKSYLNFGENWTRASNVLYNNAPTNPKKNWLAVSISEQGQYQTAVTTEGDIYISNNYGGTRKSIYNIGVSETNIVSISYTGQYQTASNGQKLFVSNDYGNNWIQSYFNGTSAIFVSISLNGKFQTLVSSGDSVYTSSDFGVTWKSVSVGSDIYQSVEAFPYASVSLSYDGRQQTIVSEHIYTSTDFGATWINASATNGLDDGNNWIAVSMSSDGEYQTAVESPGNVYRSTDYGVTWNMVTYSTLNDKDWVSVSLSATGQYQSIIERNTLVYCSNDYGVTWAPVVDSKLENRDLRSISVSSNAMYQCVCEYDGQIYMSNIG